MQIYNRLILHCSPKQAAILGSWCKEALLKILNKYTTAFGKVRLTGLTNRCSLLFLTSRRSVSVQVSHSLKSHSAHGGMNPSASGLIGSWLLSIATRFQNPLIHSRMQWPYDEDCKNADDANMGNFQFVHGSIILQRIVSSSQSSWISRKQQILMLNPKSRKKHTIYPSYHATGYCTKQSIRVRRTGALQANWQQSGVRKLLGSRLPL